jgi:hypothetical protein
MSTVLLILSRVLPTLVMDRLRRIGITRAFVFIV